MRFPDTYFYEAEKKYYAEHDDPLFYYMNKEPFVNSVVKVAFEVMK